MISAAPKITRYARGSDGLFTGTATYEVMQPHVVTYSGLYAEQEDNLVVPLQSHVRNNFLVFSIRVLSLVVFIIRLVAMLCFAGVFGLMAFGAWTSIAGPHRDFIGFKFQSSLTWMVQVMMWSIRLSFRSLIWWLKMILRYSEVRTDYSLVSTKSWSLNW
jgi:hypothetical protein